jgi:hypothetical protein
MSKIDVNVIRKESFDLINELDLNVGKNVLVSTLQEKFNNLYSNSPTLFNYILTNYEKTRHNIENENKFKENLDLLLSKILQVQQGYCTQNEASEKIGTHLANVYIPNFKNLR